MFKVTRTQHWKSASMFENLLDDEKEVVLTLLAVKQGYMGKPAAWLIFE